MTDKQVQAALRAALVERNVKPEMIRQILGNARLRERIHESFGPSSSPDLTREGQPDEAAISAYADQLSQQAGYTIPDPEGVPGRGGRAGLAEAKRRFGSQPGWSPRQPDRTR